MRAPRGWGKFVTAPIEFWFDLSSPYGYLASHKIEALAAKHGRSVDWRPMLLGVVFKHVGTAPLTTFPLKGDYSTRDFHRSARFHGIADFRMPARFPIPTQVPARIVMWAKARERALAPRVAKALYRAYFFDGIDVSDPAAAAEVASKNGVDAQAARAAVDDPQVKDALKREVDEGIARGVFGSPFVFVDGEPFWGLDRFDQIERWLATGGF
jgi:2-hydroxychromene-2-carboxylate isomerase